MPRLPALLALLLASTPSFAQQTPSPAAPVHAVVQGLAAADLLNIRQEPGPLGRTQARLPLGALVTMHECREVEGYEWCRIDAVHPDDGSEIGGWTPGRYLVALEILDAEPPGRAARLAPEDDAAALPPGIEERFAGGGALPVEAVRSGVKTRDADIPCARHLGQPMARCAARIVRDGPDAATVTVTWPDGGARVLAFRDGAPAGADAGGEFRFTREATLNLIRVGVSERFEILDALLFSD